jgi:hypothetical protein
MYVRKCKSNLILSKDIDFFFICVQKQTHISNMAEHDIKNIEAPALFGSTDLDSIRGTSTSPSHRGVNVPGGKAFGGRALDIEDMPIEDMPIEDIPIKLDTTVDTTVVVGDVDKRAVQLAKNVATLTGVNTKLEADATVKIAKVDEAQKNVAKAAEVAVKAKEAAVVAVESAKKIIENPHVSESTKSTVKKVAVQATKEAEIAKEVEKKATEKKEIAIKTAEKAVAKVKVVETKKEVVVKKLGTLQDFIKPIASPVTMTSVKYQDVCIGLFSKDDDKVVGVCPTHEGKCPVSWNESTCMRLMPVKASVTDVPITTFW